MKPFNSILISLLCCFSFLQSIAQLPFVQHPVPAGVTGVSARTNGIAIDASNNKWVSFAIYGIGIYDGTNWTMYNTTNSGIPSDSAICADFDLSGNAWIGTKAGAVYKSGSTFTVYNTSNSGLPSNVVTTIHVNGTTTWFGTYQGLTSFNGSTWTVFNTSNSGLVNDSITAFDIDVNGVLWIGTRNGVSSYNGSSWTSYTTSNSVISKYINDIACDPYGRTWVSSGNKNFNQTVTTLGIHFMQNGIVGNFIDDIYQYELPVTYPNATSISVDISGNVWFRTNIHAYGIVKVDHGQFTFYNNAYINQGSGIFGSIYEIDQNGILWTVPHVGFYFYSLDPAGYVQPLFESLTFKSHRTVDVNDVNVGINVAGDMHWDYISAKHEIPKGSGKHSVFASSFWIGGFDQGGQLHASGQTYRQTGNDYWPGPIGGMSTPFDTTTCAQFNQIWKINKLKIEEFKDEFLAGNVTNGTYIIPEEIATWPAKGNGIVVDNMAPFVDFNSNGTYNPMDGDYPLIKGDQMLYFIFNDSLMIHTETGGSRLGVEVQASVYAFSCPNIIDSNQVLNWTTLYHYDIINRSISDYDSVHMGIWSDIDLGNATDDAVGCDTTLSAAFAYNGDNDDETQFGYGQNPPMQNVKILRGTLADPGDGIDNDLDGIIDESGERTTMNSFMYYENVNNIPTGNPGGPFDYYNYLRATWGDGTHLTYGGSGYNSSNILTNFMYSGVPYSGSGWTETSSSMAPSDRRFILGSGPFSLDAGDTATLDFAFVYTWDSLSPNGLTTSIARNQADLQRVQSWFDNYTFPSCITYSVGMEEHLNISESMSVYPNPVSEKLFVNTESGTLYGKNYFIYNLLGEEISNGKFYSDNISVSHLSPQVYLIKVEFDNGTEYAKFVKW